MAAVTLAELRTRVRQRTDNEHSGSDYVTDAELTQLINYSNLELYGMLARAGIWAPDESTQTVTPTGATSYNLNSDVFMIMAVFRSQNGYKIPLSRHGLKVRPTTQIQGPALSYRATQGTIEFNPVPNQDTYEILYIPYPTTLSSDSDSVNYGGGWEEYIVVDVAVRVMMKADEGDAPQGLLRERERLLARVQDEAANQEMTESHYIGGGEQGYVKGDYVGWKGYRGPLLNIPHWLR